MSNDNNIIITLFTETFIFRGADGKQVGDDKIFNFVGKPPLSSNRI